VAATRARADRVIVLGADLEGLAAAATLARAGREVVLVERGERAGGIHAEREFHPGFRAGSVVHEAGLARSALLAPLDLERHGLAMRARPARTLVPLHGEDGRAFALGRAPRELLGLSAETEAFEAWSEFVGRLSSLVQGLLDAPPPELGSPSPGELLELVKTALVLRGRGARFVEDLLRIAPSSAADWLGETFREPALQAALAAPALVGTCFGPRAPATSALVLLTHAARTAEPEGGLASLAHALEAAARAAGVQFRLGRAPKRIRLDGAGVRGIELEDGETLDAPAVLSALDPRTTLLDLLPAGTLVPSIENAVRTVRSRGALASLALALSKPPRWNLASPDGEPERLLTARSLVELERASDPWKYGELPRAPWLDVRVEPASRAPPGSCTLSVLVQCVPTAPRSGGAARAETFVCGAWTDAERAELVATVLSLLERHAPGIRASVVGSELLVPHDLERRFGLSGGHVYAGELALDQLLVGRPSLALARYHTPIAGLFLGSSGSHPGGPFACGAGVLAARALLG
jgi:phytoene dehydrogenase-like protein